MSGPPRAPRTPAEYWDTYLPYRGEDVQPSPPVDRFEWTQYPGHGPGAEALGKPRRALDLGSGQGMEAVFLARQGVEVAGVDLSPVQVSRARTWWKDVAGLSFVQADACDYLTSTSTAYDAIYSVWGAVWFTDPDQLLPLVAQRLAASGVFAFSHAEPVPDVYAPQPMRGKWLDGRERELTVTRWQYSPQTWADLLKRHGFTGIHARVLAAPDLAGAGTLVVSARAPR